MEGIQRIKEASKIITTFLKQVAKRWLKFRLNDKIDRLNNKTSLRYTKIDLEQIFDSLFNIYISTLSDKGLFGAWKERKAILEQIRSLNFGMFDKSSKYILEPDFNESLIHLAMFKNILINIKYTVEGLVLIKTIFSLISKISFLPIFILSIWILFRRIYIWFSLLFTSSFATIYLTNQYDYISKTVDFLIKVKEALRWLSIRTHNWLFSDDLTSISEVDRAINQHMANTQANFDSSLTDRAHSLYGYISSIVSHIGTQCSEYVSWGYVGYTGAGLLLVSTAYMAYTGTITLSSISSGIKTIGSSIWSFMSYFGLGPLDKPDADDSKRHSSFIKEAKIYITNLQLNCSNAIEFKKINEAFILDTLTEMSQLSGLKLEMIKIRLTYLNKEGKKSNKLVVTSLVSQRFTASLLFDKMYDNCSILGIDLKSIIKVKLDLILIPVPLRIKPKTLRPYGINTTFKVIEVILNIIEFLFTIPPSII